jgi:hypothetical protein
MAGLVAIISTDPEIPVSPSEMTDLANTYAALRGEGRRETAHAGSAAQVAVIVPATGGEGAVVRDGSSWCAVVGRPYATGMLLGARPEDLDGQFALISHDGQTGEVRVVCDPFGMQTLHVAQRGPLSYVSTSALVLARFLRAGPDRFALEIFLRAGYHFGSRTNWNGIERLEPGTCVSFGRAGASRRCYWRPTVERDVTALGFDDAVDYCSSVALSSYERVYSGREGLWLDLTGGFDTRLLALLLETAGASFACNTRGDVDDEDRRVARKIAEQKGWELFDPTMPVSWGDILKPLLSLAVAWGDANLQALELAWVLWVHARMGERRSSLLSAGGGEHWRGFAWPQEFFRAGRSTTVNMDNWIDMRLLHPMRTDVLARDPTNEIREDFRTRMLDWAAPYGEDLNTVQLDMMYAYKMTGHFGAYRSADGACLNAELPFYLKPSFAAAISVDHRHRSSHRLMRHAIWRLDRDIASLRTVTGGPAMPLRPTAVHRFVPYYTRIGRRAITKVAQTTIGRPLLAPTWTSWWAPAAAQMAAVELLGSSAAIRRREMRSLPLYHTPALDSFLDAASAGRLTDAELLGRIVSVELALRQVDAAVAV